MPVTATRPPHRESVDNLVLDGMSELICQYDRDGTLTYVNAPFAAHHGVSCAELIGRCVFDLMPVGGRVHAQARAGLLSPENAEHVFEHKGATASGEPCWFSTTERAAFDVHNQSVRITSVARDITQEKRLRRAIERLLQVGRDTQFDAPAYISEVLASCLDYFELDLGVLIRQSDGGPCIKVAVSAHPEQKNSDTWRQADALRVHPTEGWTPVFHEQIAATLAEVARDTQYTARIDIPVHEQGIYHGNLVLCGRDRAQRPCTQQQRFFADQVATVVAGELSRCRRVDDLKQSERELSFIVDNAPVRLWFKDQENRVMRVNAAATRWLQRDRQDVVGRTTDELFEGDLREAHRRDLEVLKSGMPERNMIEANNRGYAETNWINVDKVPYADVETGAKRVLTAAIDISELKAAEAALRNVNDMLVTQRETFRRHYRQTPVMLHSAGEDGRLVEVSELWLTILGYDRSEVIGRPPSDFLTEESRNRANQAVLPAFHKNGYCQDIPYQFVRKDGTLIDVELSSMLDAGLDREAMSFTVLIDVTERNQALAALESKNADLEAANESLSQFAYVASHDLQEPLRKIQAFSDLVQQAAIERNQEDLDYATDVIQAAATRSRQLVSDLLSFSRTSNRTVEKQPIILESAVSDVIQDLAETIKSSAASVRTDLGETTIEADSTLLFQLLQNLLSNALKYQADGARPEILVGVNRDSDNLPTAFFVQDNGIGIDWKYRDAIWEPFKRLQSSEDFPGTGIGLAICASVAKRHDWQLEVQSDVGRGATFIVRLPKD